MTQSNFIPELLCAFSLLLTAFAVIQVLNTVKIRNGNGTANSCRNFSEWSGQKLENLMQLTTPRARVAAVIFFLMSALLSITLAFIVRCNEGNLISHFEKTKTSVEKEYTSISTLWQSQLKEREDKYKTRKLEWIPQTQFQKELFEPAGKELYESHNVLLYVARTSYENGTVVGKYVNHHKGMYFGYGGREVYRSECEILSYPKGTVSWMLIENGDGLPDKNALVVGGISSMTAESVYICRFNLDGHVIIGRTQQYITRCISSLDDKEETTPTFEILVINAMGRLVGVNS